MTLSRRTGMALAATVLSLALVGVGGTVANAKTASPASPRGGSVARATAVTNSRCLSTPNGVKHIYVDLSQQYLWACTGHVLLLGTFVTTGASALTNVR